MGESNILVWFHEDSHYNLAIDKIRDILTPTIDSIQMYNDPDECIDFITDHEEDTVFMVISPVVDLTIIDAIHDFAQLAIIYVFYPYSSQQPMLKDTEWCNKYPKVNVYPPLIYSSLSIQTNFIGKKICEHP